MNYRVYMRTDAKCFAFLRLLVSVLWLLFICFCLSPVLITSLHGQAIANKRLVVVNVKKETDFGSRFFAN